MSTIFNPPYVQVEVNGTDMLTLDYIEGETLGQLLQRITDMKGWRYTNYYPNVPPQILSVKDGNAPYDPNAITAPGHIYYMTAWVTGKVTS